MAPLIISGVTSLANTILDTWNQVNQPRAATQPSSSVAFDSILKARSLAGAPGVQPMQLNDASSALMQQLMARPEVAAALSGQNLPPGSQLEFGAGGGLSLRLANGSTQPLSLSPATRTLAASVQATMAGGQ